MMVVMMVCGWVSKVKVFIKVFRVVKERSAQL